jgi:hypothetical protein
MTRTGKHYLESRHDARGVFFNGDDTGNLTMLAATLGRAHSIAHCYDTHWGQKPPTFTDSADDSQVIRYVREDHSPRRGRVVSCRRVAHRYPIADREARRARTCRSRGDLITHRRC